jgi:hypothetical protein
MTASRGRTMSEPQRDLFGGSSGLPDRASGPLSEVEAGKPAVEPERVAPPEQSESGLRNPLGSIPWYAEKQREYWNAAFPHKPK